MALTKSFHLLLSVVRDLGIYIDSDVSMRSRVTKTVSSCFAVLRQLRGIRRSVLQSLVTSLVLTRLDYGNSTLVGIPLYLLKRLQSVMNSAARLASVRLVEVRPCRSTSPSTALVDGGGANRFQARSPCLQVSARSSTFVYTLPMNSASPRTVTLDVVYDPPRHHC